MITFIDQCRDQFGVEFICRTLRAAGVVFLTSRGYRAAKSRVASALARRDVQLVEVIKTVHADNYSVYGSSRCITRCVAPATRWGVSKPVG